MSVKNDIYSFMQTQSGITDIVPVGQVGWIDCDTDTPYPRIIYKKISSPPLYQSNDEWQRWRFWVFSDDKTEVLAIGDELRTAFHRLQDTMGSTFYNVFLIDESEVDRQEEMYQKYIDFRIIYVRS